MPTQANTLEKFLKLTIGQAPTNPPLNKLIEILDNDEEIVAHIILKMNAFESSPAIKNLLFSIAQQHVIFPSPMRAGGHDLKVKEDQRAQMIEAISKVIEDEKSRKTVVNDFLVSRKNVALYQEANSAAAALRQRIGISD